FDKDLLEESIFTGFLLKFIPKKKREKISIDDKVKLEYYKLQEDFQGEITLIAEDDGSGELAHPASIDASVKPVEEHDSLEEIIKRVNERFPEGFTEADRVLIETMHHSLRKNADAKLVNMARNNSSEMFERNLFKEQY